MKWIHKRTIFQEAGVIISKSIRPSPGELHRRLRGLLYHRREGMERGGGGRWTGLTARGLWPLRGRLCRRVVWRKRLTAPAEPRVLKVLKVDSGKAAEGGGIALSGEDFASQRPILTAPRSSFQQVAILHRIAKSSDIGL